MRHARPSLLPVVIFPIVSAVVLAQNAAPLNPTNAARLGELRQEASAALLAAQENLLQGDIVTAERAALDALRLDPSRSAEAYPIAVEAAWQASCLPPERPADRQHAQELLAAGLALHPGSPQLDLIRARMRLRDGAIAEAEAIARDAVEKLRAQASPSEIRLQRESFAALVHARRGEWKPAAQLVINSEAWLPGYDFHAAAAEILEHTLRDGKHPPAVLRYTRNAYAGAHDFLRRRERGPAIAANEKRQLELLTELGSWDLIAGFLRDPILPAHGAPASNAALLALFEPVARAGITAFLRESESGEQPPAGNRSALTEIDDILAGLQPRFASDIRFAEIAFDWTHALATVLLQGKPTAEEKTRAGHSVDTARKLLPALTTDWRRHAQFLTLLNRAGRSADAEAFARQLFANAAKLGVTTSEDWSGLGNAIEFSRGTGKTFTDLGFSCYERAVQIDTKTNHLNFAAIIGKLRLGALNSLKPDEALTIVNQLVAQFPAEAAARESEVFFVRKRLCQLIVDDQRPLDAALAFVTLAQVAPKDAFTYHYNAGTSLIDYITAQSTSSVRLNRSLPDVRSGLNRPAVETIFDQMMARYPVAPDRVIQLKAQKERLSLAVAHGAARVDTSQWTAAQVTALADSIRTLRLGSPASQHNEFRSIETYIHAYRLEALARQSEYTSAQLDEAKLRRDRVVEIGGPHIGVARENYDAMLSRNRQILAAREAARSQQAVDQERRREAEARAATLARSQPAPAPEPRWRWCLRCSGSGYRTVWDNAQDSYTGRFRTTQMNRTCDRCFGQGKLPY